MNNWMFISLIFLKFWFIEAPVAIITFFASLNNYTMQLFALPLSIKTFFKPLKNEYREGLVGFSRALGIFVKSGLIIADLFLLSVLLISEILIVAGFMLFPFATALLLFINL